MNLTELVETFIFFFAVIDPIGTIPIFIAVTSRLPVHEWNRVALRAIIIATIILLFFIVAGEFILEAIGVPLSAFRIAGGIVLFIFALSMIFGESKPDEELKIVSEGKDTAVFPLAIPSIAGPGAMLAAIVMTDNHRFSFSHQLLTTGVMIAVLALTLLLLLTARWIYRVIGMSGASIISRVMGLILAAIATTNVLEGIRRFFEI